MSDGIPRANFGHVQVTLPPPRMLPPTAAQSYLVVAEALTSSIQVLAATQNIHPLGHTLLCGQALECILKAYLCGTLGPPRAQAFGHDIRAAWDASAAAGLPVSTPMPAWAESLHVHHAKPYLGRYAQGLNGFVFGVTQDVTSGIVDVLKIVRPLV